MTMSPTLASSAAAPLIWIGPRARLALDRVGDEARPVGAVPDVDELVREDVGLLEQVGVDGDAADVVDVAAGHGRAVDLRLEHLPLHGRVSSLLVRFPAAGRSMTTLSISRARPTRAATASRTGRPLKLSIGSRRLGVARLEVLGLDRRPRSRTARAASSAAAVGRAWAAASCGGAQRPATGRSARSRSSALEVGVARRHRQAVGLADGRQDLDLDREVEVADHPPDHDGLLGVLLAEVGDVGADRVEELGDDRRDPAEVLGAAARRVAAEDLGQARRPRRAVPKPSG